jgi:hypothetical protein
MDILRDIRNNKNDSKWISRWLVKKVFW